MLQYKCYNELLVYVDNLSQSEIYEKIKQSLNELTQHNSIFILCNIEAYTTSRFDSSRDERLYCGNYAIQYYTLQTYNQNQDIPIPFDYE